MNTQKKVGIWIRVSTEDQAQGESPDHHAHRGRLYADLKGWQVVEVYNLAGVSGKSVITHPEAQRMLMDIQSGKINGLIFSKLARLARSTKELLQFAEFFKKHNADLISIEENIDTSSPAGRLLYTMIAALAEWEREEISSRVKASVKTRAKMGKSLGGAAPYGYKWVNKELQLNLDEAPIRKKMFELFAEHKRIKYITKLLNEMGYRSRKGKQFAFTTVKRLLSDPIAKGLRRVNYTKSNGDTGAWILKPEEEWEFVEVPAIVSKELWEKCNKILQEDYREGRRGKLVKQLFAGYIICHCETKMYAKSSRKKYICKNCKNTIGIEDAEIIFKEYLQDFLFNEEEIQTHLNVFKEEVISQEEEIERLEGELEKLGVAVT